MVFDLGEIVHLVQMAVAPVFLLTGIAGLLAVLSSRMSRIVDRGHMLAKFLDEGVDYLVHKTEIESLGSRLNYAHKAIFFCSLSALVICSVVICIFIGAFANIHFGLPVAILFSISMILLILALFYFLMEVKYSILSIKHAVKIFN